MKDSMKKALLTLGSMVFAGLTLVFFAVPNVYMGEGNFMHESSGFDYYDAGIDFMKAMLILTCIFAGIVVLFGIAKILADSKVISSKGVAKIVNFIFVISAMALVVCAVLYCIAIGAMCGDTAIGSYQVLNPTVWALVLMSIFGALSFLFGLFSLSGGKKRK